MIRAKSIADLQPWLERAKTSLVASFANGVIKDQRAAAALAPRVSIRDN
jgi:hypothetical protein